MGNKIRFYVSSYNNINSITKKNIIVLFSDSWDDWFTYSTVYNLYFYDADGVRDLLGSIKIGEKNMKGRRPQLPEYFDNLEESFFSLGQDVTYYEKLNNLGEDIREDILVSLNDIALNSDIYKEALKENVTRISLMRDVSKTSIEGQFRRLAQGIATLTPYNFKYIAPKNSKSLSSDMILDFSVTPNSIPPTNIHVIIGRNGVGKTHLFNNMINALLNGNKKGSKYGYFTNEGNEYEDLFANLVSVSFSAFDDTQPYNERRDKFKNLSYSYVGLKRIGKESDRQLPPKSPTILKNEFVKSVEKSMLGAKNERWLAALKMLETDPIFKEAEISKIANLSFKEFEEIASNTFHKLSSGHKIILLTITRLVETIEERSLVILDEPEAYLHPPLLSAFIRALSNLLVKRNGVAIIGTHSPVVLQEVPQCCAWKLRRTGANAIAERLNIESFGENVGILTQEIFGLEVTDSGFHRVLKELSLKNNNYNDALEVLNNQLGLEGKAILRNLFFDKNEEN